MIIIAIMAAVTAPRLISFATSRRTNDIARTFLSLAHYARTTAIGEGRIYRLNIDSSSRPQKFYLTAQNGATYEAPTTDYGQEFTVPDSVSMDTDLTPQTDGTYIVFNPSGRTQEAQVRFTDLSTPGRKVVTVACPSATENFRILLPGEVVP